MEDIEFLKKGINNLEEENKRLRKQMINTIKINIEYKGNDYEVDTQISKELIEGKDCYLCDSYQEPTKVRLIDYEVGLSTGNKYYIYASTFNYKTKEIEYRDFKNLFKTKSKASDEYLKREGW